MILPGAAGKNAKIAEQRAHTTSRGFTYIALLVAIVIIGISLGSAGRYWQNISLRDREEELLFRGDQYRLAIERYYFALPGRMQYPPSVDDLLKDNRTPTGKRHLRRKYLDPITNKEFVEIRDQLSKRIIGFNSPSDQEPLRRGNFPDQYKEFAKKEKYSEWQFIFLPRQGLPGAPQPLRPTPMQSPPIPHAPPG